MCYNEGCLLFILIFQLENSLGSTSLGGAIKYLFIILFLFLLLLAFHPKVYIVLSRVCMNDYKKFNSRRRTIRIASEVAQTPTVHHISKEKWKQAKDYSQEKDVAMKIFGEKPSPEQIMERYKGVVYQRKKNMIPTKSSQHMPKVKTPPPLDLNIDLGDWLSSAKIYVAIIEILKIPSQRDIFMKTLA